MKTCLDKVVWINLINNMLHQIQNNTKFSKRKDEISIEGVKNDLDNDGKNIEDEDEDEDLVDNEE